jgi:hypothetical protein
MGGLMKKLALLLLACAVCMWAADFWTSKPYTDWSAKELQKMMSDSPWAHRVDVELSVRMPNVSSQSESGGRGRGKGGGGGDIATADGGATSGADLSGTRGGAGGPAGAGGGPNDGPVTQTMPVMLVWQTALPVKQALMKAKFGAEAASSADAKTYLEREEQYIVLNVGGLPTYAAQSAEGDAKAALLKLTSLNVKGKDPLRAVEVQFSKRERVVDALFFFPRATAGSSGAFSSDDKELEFSTKFEKLAVKYRFKLKDMLYHGKLEL